MGDNSEENGSPKVKRKKELTGNEILAKSDFRTNFGYKKGSFTPPVACPAL